ncbi:MAG TPA: isoprenylcysteine carboxylmethyltransferase family protein [Longimicrobiaceae bacterium]|nr:isoprenylcysteine carboxylmethyltransferase family protein [Longimicrobiaceae bacterium]
MLLKQAKGPAVGMVRGVAADWDSLSAGTVEFTGVPVDAVSTRSPTPLPREVTVLLLLKNLLFTVLVPGTVAVYLPLRIAGGAGLFGPHGHAWDPWRIAGLLPLSVGAAVYFWCLWDFAVHGRGTPAPVDAPRHLVVRGLYRYVRNPMYIGVLLVIVGWAVWFRSWSVFVYAVAAGSFFHLFVVLVEEPLLRHRFGEAYESYCGQVGRWVPGLGRGKGA